MVQRLSTPFQRFTSHENSRRRYGSPRAAQGVLSFGISAVAFVLTALVMRLFVVDEWRFVVGSLAAAGLLLLGIGLIELVGAHRRQQQPEAASER